MVIDNEEILTPVAQAALLFLAANPSSAFTKGEISRGIKRRVSLTQMIPLCRHALVIVAGSAAYKITEHGRAIAGKIGNHSPRNDP
jgi:hypothetical protein